MTVNYCPQCGRLIEKYVYLFSDTGLFSECPECNLTFQLYTEQDDRDNCTLIEKLLEATTGELHAISHPPTSVR